jgi:ACS family tartrate transporter-like MFS transporter
MQFYVMRFLLGAAEAAFFPGIIVYMGRWFSSQDRAKAVAGFMIGIPIASIIGSPLAGVILGLHFGGWNGWRLLFVAEGLPAVILGLITFFYLTDRPQDASWLPPDEREWLIITLTREATDKPPKASHSFTVGLQDIQVITLAVVYLLGDTGLYGFTIWFPTILQRASGYSTLVVTLVGVLPYIAALTADLVVGWHSDRTGERRWHTALPLFTGALVLFVGLVVKPALLAQIGLFIILAASLHCWQPCFWTLPTSLLDENAAAASVGFINSVGHIGAFSGPFVIGYLRTEYHSFAPGLTILLISLVTAGLLVLSVAADSTATPCLSAKTSIPSLANIT